MATKVVIVEDNELNLRLFRDVLEAHGAQVLTIRDAREAISAIRTYAPHLIIMDIQLPHISGTDLIKLIRADPAIAQLPIMAITAYAGKGDEIRVRAAGANAYVSKPISVTRFVAEIEELAGPLEKRLPPSFQ